jgi:LysR substrate binding domain.
MERDVQHGLSMMLCGGYAEFACASICYENASDDEHSTYVTVQPNNFPQEYKGKDSRENGFEREQKSYTFWRCILLSDCLDDDYMIISMVENGLGISILAELILKRTPYNIITKETSPSFSRSIGIALKNRQQASMAVRCFLDYIVANKERYISLVK